MFTRIKKNIYKHKSGFFYKNLKLESSNHTVLTYQIIVNYHVPINKTRALYKGNNMFMDKVEKGNIIRKNYVNF